MDVVVDVGSGEREDEGAVRMGVAETDDRIVTASGVEGDEEVGLSFVPALKDADVMAQITEDAGPSKRGDPVALTGTGWSGGYDVDFQRQKINHEGTKKGEGKTGEDPGKV